MSQSTAANLSAAGSTSPETVVPGNPPWRNNWRSKELLWGTNYERFWPNLKVWNREDSLIWWIITQQRRKRQRMHAMMGDPAWSHITFIRLGSAAEIDAFGREVGFQATEWKP